MSRSTARVISGQVLVGFEPTEVTAYDLDAKLANHWATKALQVNI